MRAMVKKLIVKFKNWLILKLGGYVYPMSAFKVHKTEIKLITLFASMTLNRDERALTFMSPEAESAYIEEYLTKLIAQEIKNRHLYEINTYADYKTDSDVYRMKCLVVQPDGR